MMMKIEKKAFLYLSIFIVLITFGISYVHWDAAIMSPITYLVYILIILKVFSNYKKITGCESVFKTGILSMFLLPLISVLPLYAYGEESVFHSIRFFLEPSVYLVYFLLIYYQVNPETIKKLLLIWGIIIAVIFIVQQLMPDYAVFGVFSKAIMKVEGLEEQVYMRNGLYRYRLDSFFYVSLFSVFYAWNKLTERHSLFYLLLFLIYAVAIYLYLARQILAITIFVIAISMVIEKKQHKLLIPIAALSIGLYAYKDLLFGNFLESTNDDLNSDYIRFFTFNFFWNKIIDNPIVFLFGHGHMPNIERMWADNLSVYTADVGLIGPLYYHGIVWFVAFVAFLVSIFKKFDHMPLYLKMFFLSITIDLIFISPTERASHMFFMMLAVYLLECHLYVKSKNIYRKKSVK
ncbi:hypothetical protein [Prevotella sp.]|jgi:hypothetical protein|uniref:hypothetical protein n=1 Tax=Prevotella sp. TaxID=59823 RepID=UPI0025FA77EE|nr:hypothetical protein [Prevotella sp.]